jgi:predicted component of type VI protein secretion system
VIAREISERLSRALGEAVVRIWSQLLQHVQCHLFEEAIIFQGEGTRPELAIFLHERHPRTSASIQARAMLEPDSLGG